MADNNANIRVTANDQEVNDLTGLLILLTENFVIPNPRQDKQREQLIN